MLRVWSTWEDIRDGCWDWTDCFWMSPYFRKPGVESLEPDIDAPLRYEDYVAGRDAALEAHGRQWLRFVAVNSLGAVVNYGTYVLVLAIGTASAILPGIGVAAGSLAEAKAQNKVRLEGKGYEVQDGDVIEIRFSV